MRRSFRARYVIDMKPGRRPSIIQLRKSLRTLSGGQAPYLKQWILVKVLV